MKQQPLWIERITGVKAPFAKAALYEFLAAFILLLDLFWPRLSLPSLIKGGLIAGLWSVMGIISYFVEMSRHVGGG